MSEVPFDFFLVGCQSGSDSVWKQLRGKYRKPAMRLNPKRNKQRWKEAARKKEKPGLSDAPAVSRGNRM